MFASLGFFHDADRAYCTLFRIRLAWLYTAVCASGAVIVIQLAHTYTAMVRVKVSCSSVFPFFMTLIRFCLFICLY